MTMPTLTGLDQRLPRPAVLIGWLVLAAVLLGSYGSVIVSLIGTWWREPDYGHGFAVPVFALWLLWRRREMVDPLPDRGTWWSMAFLATWAMMRWVSVYFTYAAVDKLSLLPCLIGFTLFIGGWRALRWAWPSIAFLVFMLPLPGLVAGMLSQPLQRLGTIVSVGAIQTLGIPAVAVGNVIKLENTELQVVQACSGLRMLMLFFAVCVGAAFVIRSAPWEKIVLVVSAVPIAIFANMVRITLTALLHHMQLGALADEVFHDGAGLLMMPIALGVLWGEMALMKRLFLEPESDRPVILGQSFIGGSRKPDF